MSELLPPVQASAVQRGVKDYLTTTFALTDADARDALDRFLDDPATGIFKGPYVRLRLPFRPADPGWRSSLEWYEGPEPYGHQAAAFERLASQVGGVDRRPLPTLVTTGTGSGKTEAFLHPILDHVLRARRAGVRGTKALILYPMNALANDQAQRLARLIIGHPALSAVTAALYTGQTGPPRTVVTADGLITDRGIIRDEAPDLLLTNYKMLDQLLLRAEDQDLWRQSATSLQYLVLDEFHTYDGAQGTDVAMLLRRLGLALKSHWSDDDPALTEADRARPLGRMTPVATSATLGSGGSPLAMTGFAEAVFGEPFDAGAVITESRLSVAEWTAGAAEAVAAAGLTVVDASAIDVTAALADVQALGADPNGADLAQVVLARLYEGVPDGGLSDEQMLAATRAHPVVRALAEAHDAVTVDDLVAAVLGKPGVAAARAARTVEAWEELVSAVVAMLGHVRAVCGRRALSLDLHLWVRELTRIDRAADATATFRWSDDGIAADDQDGAALGDVHPSFPAIYCRHCGRSGWQVGMAPVGDGLATDDANIRRQHARREGRSRALLHAPGEAETTTAGGEAVTGLVWLSVRGRTLLTEAPAEDDPDLRDGWVLPVLTTTGRDGDKAADDDTCPSCGRADAIRFLGSAIATLLSVSLSILFGSGALDPREKKALVFTDSVQDAAHRAGFVQARSHALTLRAVLREAVEDGALTLTELVDAVMRRAGDDTFARYRVIAPDCADRDAFSPFWTEQTQRAVPVVARRRVKQRLAFDAAIEMGLGSRTGRTLELTGAVAVEVEAGQPSRLAATARAAVAGVEVQGSTAPSGGTDAGDPAPSFSDAALITWVRGVLDRMRAQGAIDHPWFDRYRAEDGVRWPIWGGRPKHEGMPAFPRGRPAPAYPRVGGALGGVDSGLDPVTSPQSWYAIWTSRVLDVSPADGGRLARLLLERLARDGVLGESTSKSGASVYAIPAEAVVVSPTSTGDLAAGRHLLACDTCRALTPGSATTVEQLAGAPCTTVRCRGRLAPAPLAAGFYRDLYSSPDVRRVVAREHTSLLDDETRLEYEDGFKRADVSPSDPNVLVATPTLEMGIDIGNLSAVFLASLPRTVASYVQRVGRAGRLTGNALNLAYVTGRGDQLPKLGEPLSVINGEVLPPATYLAAEAILQRQYTAHLVDAMARDAAAPHPRKAGGALGSADPGTFLGHLVALAESQGSEHLDRFLDAFGDALPEAVVDALRTWASPTDGPGTSALAKVLHDASGRWQRSVAELGHRLAEIEKVRKVSTWVGQFAWSFVESGGGLIQAGPGSGAGWGRWRTKRSGWAV